MDTACYNEKNCVIIAKNTHDKTIAKLESKIGGLISGGSGMLRMEKEKMRAVCVDDEELVLQLTVSLCEELPLLTEVKGFDNAAEALAYIAENGADIVILDIDMPEMNGIQLAMKIKEAYPGTAILFLTGYARYALDAFALHASGYLLKPVNAERLAAEIGYVLGARKESVHSHIEARTFGEFDIFVDGTMVDFRRAKAKEVLAYLIDRQGASVRRAVIYAALWEDGIYNRSKQKYLDVIIRSLKDTLSEYGVSDILVNKNGMLRICPEKINCDAYRFFTGDLDAINSYRGEYMSTYPWASMSEAYLDKMKGSAMGIPGRGFGASAEPGPLKKPGEEKQDGTD